MLYLSVWLILIISAYSILAFVLISGWQKIKEIKKGSTNPFFISLIVAARNEEQNIKHLLDALVQQSYSKHFFEVIIIDDASDDQTAEIIQSYCSKYEHFKSISFKTHKGKKTAVDFAVKNAKGKLIIQTDADCMPHKDWLQTTAFYYQQEHPQMIIAPVLMKYGNFFEAMQSLDFLALMASGMATAGFGKPIMNNAANMAFEKQAYLNLSNPNNKETNSGDDVFLLLNLKKEQKSIKVLKSRKAVVYTNAQKTFKDLIRQRMRWTSKSKYYRDKDIIFTAITVLLTNFSLLFFLILTFFQIKSFLFFAGLFLIKSFLDYIFLRKAAIFFREKSLLRYFLPTQFFNIFLVPWVAFTGMFSHNQWK